MIFDPCSRAIAPRITAAIMAAVMLLTSPAARADETQTADLAVASVSAGILETSAGIYEFTPKSCVIFMEDGVPDIEIQGPGTAPDGESFYFDFSSTANEMSIELGVDAPFKSTDRSLRAGQFISTAFTVEVGEDVVTVTDLNLVDEQGEAVDTSASLSIDCSK